MGRFKTIYDGFKALIQGDALTSDLKHYAGDNPAKPLLPAVVAFPRKKRKIKKTDVGRRRKLPRKTWYDLDILIVADVKKREALLFGSGSIEDWAEKIEEVLDKDHTLSGVCFDTDWGDIDFGYRPGFIAVAAFTLSCRLTEVE